MIMSTHDYIIRRPKFKVSSEVPKNKNIKILMNYPHSYVPDHWAPALTHTITIAYP